MLSTPKCVLAAVTVVGLLVTAATLRTAAAAGQTLSAAAQSANAAAPVVPPKPQQVAAGETEAKKLLVLMDADKNGKVSRAEFMAFMAAEFDRLDTNHDGELDVKELEKSQLMTAHHGGGHR